MQSVWNISPEPRAHRLLFKIRLRLSLICWTCTTHRDRRDAADIYPIRIQSKLARPSVINYLRLHVYYISIRSSICISTAAASRRVFAHSHIARAQSQASLGGQMMRSDLVCRWFLCFECFKALMRRVLERGAFVIALILLCNSWHKHSCNSMHDGRPESWRICEKSRKENNTHSRELRREKRRGKKSMKLSIRRCCFFSLVSGSRARMWTSSFLCALCFVASLLFCVFVKI